MIEVDGAVLKIVGPVTIETHTKLRDNAAAHIGLSNWDIDWSKVTEVDSSALAIIFAWLRVSLEKGKTLRNVHFPANLEALAALYGVAELIPVA
jgi:phospholipid transport system transporter-binding protein